MAWVKIYCHIPPGLNVEILHPCIYIFTRCYLIGNVRLPWLNARMPQSLSVPHCTAYVIFSDRGCFQNSENQTKSNKSFTDHFSYKCHVQVYQQVYQKCSLSSSMLCCREWHCCSVGISGNHVSSMFCCPADKNEKWKLIQIQGFLLHWFSKVIKRTLCGQNRLLSRPEIMQCQVSL